MKVYLIHAKHLNDRLQHCMRILLQCRFIEDVEIVTSENSSAQFATAKETTTVLPQGFPLKDITELERSVWHKHYRVFEKIERSNQISMVLEDDVIFDPKQLDDFVEKTKDIPQDLDWCFFGTGLNMKIPGTGFVKNENRFKSKCADSMLIRPSAAQKVIEDIRNDKIYAAIDWDLNWRFLKHKMNVYWYEPGIIIQGSENGKFKPCHNR